MKQEKLGLAGLNCWTMSTGHAYHSVAFGGHSESNANEIGRAVMPDIFETSAVRAGAAMLILAVMIAAAFYLLSSFRDYAAEDKEPQDETLAKLQEMHRKGDISDEEFRTIQATTHRRLTRSNVNNDSPPGEASSPT